MAGFPASVVYERTLRHLLQRVEATPALNEPFSHAFFEDVLPSDIYAEVLRRLPADDKYVRAAERHTDGEGHYVRSLCSLTAERLREFPGDAQELWCGVAAALTAEELKRALYAKLHKDLAYRYGVPASKVPALAGFARPTLYRETDGFEIAPHPDTRRKVVTMALYLPADQSQIDLGTALYRHKYLALPVGGWRGRFLKVKQFPFLPNSAYAFVVNNTLTRKSWHGREELPAGAGVRNTLLNTFYESVREGYDGYLDQPARAA